MKTFALVRILLVAASPLAGTRISAGVEPKKKQSRRFLAGWLEENLELPVRSVSGEGTTPRLVRARAAAARRAPVSWWLAVARFPCRWRCLRCLPRSERPAGPHRRVHPAARSHQSRM